MIVKRFWLIISVAITVIAGFGFYYQSVNAVLRIPSECSDVGLNWSCHYGDIVTSQTWANDGKKHVIIGPLKIKSGATVTINTPNVWIKQNLNGPNGATFWEPGGITVDSNGSLIATQGTTFASLEDGGYILDNPVHRWLGITANDFGYISLTNAKIIGATTGLKTIAGQSSIINGGEIAGNTIGVNIYGTPTGNGNRVNSTQLIGVNIYNNQTDGVVLYSSWSPFRLAKVQALIKDCFIHDNLGDGIHTSTVAQETVINTVIDGNYIYNNTNGIWFGDDNNDADLFYTSPTIIRNNTIYNNTRLAIRAHAGTQIENNNTLLNNGPGGQNVIFFPVSTVLNRDGFFTGDPTVVFSKTITWTKQNSNQEPIVYVIGGDINLVQDRSLIIEPGVITRWYPQAGLQISRSQLRIGSVDNLDKVLLTSVGQADINAGGSINWLTGLGDDPSQNIWDGVLINSQQTYGQEYSSVVRNAVFSYATIGLKITNNFFAASYHQVFDSEFSYNQTNGLDLQSATFSSDIGYNYPEIRGSFFHHNGGCGLNLYPVGNYSRSAYLIASIYDSVSTQNLDGACLSNSGGGYGGGSTGFLTATFDNLTSSDNTRDGFNFAANGRFVDHLVNVDNSHFINNGRYGIYGNNSRLTVANSDIYDNADYELYNNSPGISSKIVATNNYWGSDFGPYDIANAGAEAQNICTDHDQALTDGVFTTERFVSYRPWLTSGQAQDAPTVQTIDGRTVVIGQTITDVNLNPAITFSPPAGQLTVYQAGTPIWRANAQAGCNGGGSVNINNTDGQFLTAAYQTSGQLQEATLYQVILSYDSQNSAAASFITQGGGVTGAIDIVAVGSQTTAGRGYVVDPPNDIPPKVIIVDQFNPELTATDLPTDYDQYRWTIVEKRADWQSLGNVAGPWVFENGPQILNGYQLSGRQNDFDYYKVFVQAIDTQNILPIIQSPDYYFRQVPTPAITHIDGREVGRYNAAYDILPNVAPWYVPTDNFFPDISITAQDLPAGFDPTYRLNFSAYNSADLSTQPSGGNWTENFTAGQSYNPSGGSGNRDDGDYYALRLVSKCCDPDYEYEIYSPYYFFKKGVPWLQTGQGDVYAGGPIRGRNVKLIGPEGVRLNATYCLLANGQIENFTTATSACQQNDFGTLQLPKAENNYLSENLGLLDIKGILAGRYGTVIPNSCNILSTVLVLNDRVYYCRGDMTIGELTLNNGTGFGDKGRGLFIVEGDLYINGNIGYGTSPLTTIENLASLGVLAVKNPTTGQGGNIYIDRAVTSLVGGYFAEGQIQTAAGLGSSRQPLNVSGLMIADSFNFGRTYVDIVNGLDQPAEKIYYDGRLLLNTPLGMSDLARSLPVWQF